MSKELCKNLTITKKTYQEINNKRMGDVRTYSSENKDDFSTPHPPKDPPESYSPKKFSHKAFKPPKCIPIKAFRTFQCSEEVLGPDAGKTKDYKNPEYFSYHRFSFVTLQSASIKLGQHKEFLEESDQYEKDDDEECNTKTEKMKQELEAERIRKEAKRYEKEDCEKKKQEEMKKEEAKVSDKCKKEPIQLKKVDQEEHCKSEAERIQKETERFKEEEMREQQCKKELARYEKEDCGKKEQECKKEAKEPQDCKNEDKEMKQKHCKNEADRIKKEAERYKKEEMMGKCNIKKPGQNKKEAQNMTSSSSKEVDKVPNNPAIISITKKKK